MHVSDCRECPKAVYEGLNVRCASLKNKEAYAILTGDTSMFQKGLFIHLIGECLEDRT